MLRRRQFLHSLGSGCAGALLAGCARRRPGNRLVVAAYPSIDEVARHARPAWSRLHPKVPLQVVSRQVGDHHTAMLTALATGEGLPDVMAIEVGYLGRFARGGGLQDLARPPFGAAALRRRYTPYAYDEALQPDGRVVALPCDIGPGTMLYRADLLQAAGVALPDMQASWAAMLRAGQSIRRRTGAWLVADAGDVLDIAMRDDLPAGSGLYFDAQGQPALQQERFLRAFELAAQVRRLGLDARVRAWSPAWASAIRRGRIATLMSGAWLVGHLESWLAPHSRGLWRAAQLPAASWVAYGGSFLAVPARLSPQRKALAWDFLRLLSLDPQRQLWAFKHVDAFPVLPATYDDAFFDAPIGYLGGQRARRLWRSAALNIRAVRVDAQDAFAQEVVGSALYDVLHEGVPAPRALARAQRLLQQRVGQG